MVAHGALQYEGEAPLQTRRVYFDGGVSADEIKAGYALAYKVTTAGSAVLEDNDPTKRLGVVVTKPVTANLKLFAGIVVNGRSGAGWVDIYVPVPGSEIDMWVKADADPSLISLGLVNNDYALGAITFDAELTVARSIEVADTAAAAALMLCRFI